MMRPFGHVRCVGRRHAPHDCYRAVSALVLLIILHPVPKCAAYLRVHNCHNAESCKSNYDYKFYPTYHLGPRIDPLTKVGWMDDPNGFCLYKGEYHLFYQYNPNSSELPVTSHWGHAKSKDLMHWEHLSIALYPDQDYDRNGVYSGSVLIDNDVMYIYYTGNVNHLNNDPDHEQRQNLAKSNDGYHFQKVHENPIIMGHEHQPNFRDPKVWKHGKQYYMVLGNSFDKNRLGRVLLYYSRDKENWEQVSVLAESDGFLGYMWDCPDFFELNGFFVLFVSAQGIKSQGDKYKNLFSTGYIIGTFDYKTNLFTEIHAFKELDHGHDFYCSQTIVDKGGDRVVMAWMDMWGQRYPESLHGFKGQMTIPRRLKLSPDGHLLQQPIREIQRAIGSRLYSGLATGGTKVALMNNAAKIEVTASKMNDFSLYIESCGDNDTVKLSYSFLRGRVSLERGGKDSVRQWSYRPKHDQLNVAIYIDSSSIEAFFGRGEVVFSSRIFPRGSLCVRLDDSSYSEMFVVSEIWSTVSRPHPY